MKIDLSSKLQENSTRKKHPCCTPMLHINLCALSCLKHRLSCLKPFDILSEKLHLSQKLHYFRGSRFSQCFILSTALHCSLPSKFLCSQLFWVITNSVQCLKKYKHTITNRMGTSEITFFVIRRRRNEKSGKNLW